MAGSLSVPIASSDYKSGMLRIKELEEIVADLKKDNEAKAAIITEQSKLIEELKANLAKYENPHTPSSAQRYKKKSESKNASKKRGAPNWHRGATRATPEPDRVVEVTADQCDHCGSTNLDECGVEKQVIVEIPPPPKIEVIQFNRHKYKCQDCEHEFTAKDEECPQKGRFGVNPLVYLTMIFIKIGKLFAGSSLDTSVLPVRPIPIQILHPDLHVPRSIADILAMQGV